MRKSPQTPPPAPRTATGAPPDFVSPGWERDDFGFREPSFDEVTPIQSRHDDMIREDIVARLAACGLDIIDVVVTSGVVTLGGVVPSLSTKRAAEDAALATPGVVDCHNNLRLLAEPTQ
jgi:hypothetical protein